MKTLCAIPYAMLYALLFAAGFVVKACQRNPISEHDRFADRAIYSDDPAVDPLA